MFKQIISGLLVFAFCTTLQSKPKPHQLAMSTTWTMEDCPKGSTCSTGDNTVDITWNYDPFLTTDCKDTNNKDIKNYYINVFVTNNTNNALEVKISDFDAYAHELNKLLQGQGTLSVDYNIAKNDTTVFGYTEECFSAKTDSGFISKPPTLSKLELTVTQ